MTTLPALIIGAVLALGGRTLLVRVTLWKLRRDVDAINHGDYGPLLRGYADDAVLVFNEGDHRWAGTHRGKARIERFLQDFTAAGLKGDVTGLSVAGPPWALTMMVRFDDRAAGPDGHELYRNRVVMLVRTRWGKIVHHEDFYEDTNRILEFDRRLTELGIEPVGVS